MTPWKSFFPCQVQLMSRPENIERTRPAPPPPAMLNKACRNLFGKPEPGEIARLLREEEDQKMLYIKDRYKIDIRSLEEKESPKEIPNLILMEQQAYEEKLKQQKKSLPIKRTKTECNSQNKSKEKPYQRQTLMTDTFNKRKSLPVSVKSFNDLFVKSACEELSSIRNEIEIEIVDLQKPSRAILTNISCEDFLQEASPSSCHQTPTSLSSSLASEEDLTIESISRSAESLNENSQLSSLRKVVAAASSSDSCDSLDKLSSFS